MLLHRDHRLKPNQLFVDETIFANQNRYMGVRNNFEEGILYQETIRGTYINGYYDTHIIEYGERAYGFPDLAQTIVNVPDAQSIYFVINNQVISLKNAKLIDMKRTFDLSKGFTQRVVTYELKPYGLFILTFIRRTHLKHKELFMNEVSVQSETYQGEVKVISTLNGNVENYVSKKDPRIASKNHKKISISKSAVYNDYGALTVTTKQTKMDLLAAITHSENFDYDYDKGEIIATKIVQLKPKKPFNFTKFAIYHSSLKKEDLEASLKTTLKLIGETSLETLIASHEETLNEYNQLSKVTIESEDSSMNATIAYNLYQLYTSGAFDSTVNIPAKGLTGEGYEGHTFWDTEIYMTPYFMQVSPKTIKDLLLYRYHQLPNAKKEAETLGVKEGAKFAWRTINGDETSAYYPAGTAQYHINSDIAYTIIKYYQLYKDQEFMDKYGFEILLETARFFKHTVYKHRHKYHLHHVTGPDEYTAVIDNNYYTNSLIKYHLSFLIDYIEAHALEISREELMVFKDIKEHIVLLYDDKLGIDVQDQSFLTKKPWDFENTPKENYPLLLHYHPLTIYRHQVLKQPDTVLSHVLLNNRPRDVQKRSFDYYERLTTHDSSLSYCIHALQSARLDQLDKAYNYFSKIVTLDIDNLHGNTQYGLHLANLGGIYLALLKGFIGYELDEQGIMIRPKIPRVWKTLSMTIRVDKDTLVNIKVTSKNVTCTATKDTKIKIYEESVSLKKGISITIDLRY